MIHKLQLVKEDLFLSCCAKYGCLHGIGSERKKKKTIDYFYINMKEQKCRFSNELCKNRSIVTYQIEICKRFARYLYAFQRYFATLKSHPYKKYKPV